jgi:hypothetical protein
MPTTPIADGQAAPFDPAEAIDKLHMAPYALTRGDTATAELRTRQAAVYWRLMDVICWLLGHRGKTRYCLRCARRIAP